MEIKVLGPGCKRCEKAEKAIREAVSEMNVDAMVEKVTDIAEIAKYGVFVTPAVLIDGEVKCVGTVPKKKEIKKWLES